MPNALTCRLYGDTCTDECNGTSLCSFGDCVLQDMRYSQFFVAAMIYYGFGVIVLFQTLRLRKRIYAHACLRCLCRLWCQGRDKATTNKKSKPPVLLFLALSLFSRGTWFMLMDFWTFLTTNLGCGRTLEIETQYPSLIFFNLLSCLLLFSTISVIAMFLSQVCHDAEVSLSTSRSGHIETRQNHLMSMQMYNYVFEHSKVWGFRCTCIHKRIFFVAFNLWAYVIAGCIWLIQFRLICVNQNPDMVKIIFQAQLALVAFLFAILLASLVDTRRRLMSLMSSLQMDRLPSVQRFILKNTFLFIAATAYLFSFNATQLWRIFSFEKHFGTLASEGDELEEENADFNTCHLLYPHFFYTFPEIFLSAVLLYIIHPTKQKQNTAGAKKRRSPDTLFMSGNAMRGDSFDLMGHSNATGGKIDWEDHHAREREHGRRSMCDWGRDILFVDERRTPLRITSPT